MNEVLDATSGMVEDDDKVDVTDNEDNEGYDDGEDNGKGPGYDDCLI